jgi:hypothetical protein
MEAGPWTLREPISDRRLMYGQFRLSCGEKAQRRLLSVLGIGIAVHFHRSCTLAQRTTVRICAGCGRGSL